MRTHINVADLTQNVDELIDRIDVLIRKEEDDLEENLQAAGFVEPKKAVEVIGILEDEWTEAFNTDCDELLDALEKALDLDDFVENIWPGINSSEDLRNAIYDTFFSRFKDMLETSVVGFLAGEDPDLLSDELGILSEPAKAFVERWSGELADLMNLSTRNQIENILINGQEEHKSVAQVAQDIADSGIRDAGYKARRAAITEVLRAESYGQLEAMRQNPGIIEKEWVHTGTHKNKPRENHKAISGQRVAVNEPFSLSGYAPMCPRDTNLPASESINCHCMMKQIRDPNWSNYTYEEKQALREARMEELNAAEAF